MAPYCGSVNGYIGRKHAKARQVAHRKHRLRQARRALAPRRSMTLPLVHRQHCPICPGEILMDSRKIYVKPDLLLRIVPLGVAHILTPDADSIASI